MAKNFKVNIKPEGDAPVEKNDEFRIGDVSLWDFFNRAACETACDCEDLEGDARQERLDEILAQTAELSAAINVLAGVIQSLREEI